MTDHLIPFNRPVSLGTEGARLVEAIVGHAHTASGGPSGAACESWLTQQIGRPTLLTSSCTHALEMAALLLGIGPGDEVVVPAFTFVSTANAFALRGATIRFVDVDAQGHITPEAVAEAVSPRTRAVVAVHYGGTACDLVGLQAACGDVPLVEDAAQAFGASLDGKALGAWGTLGARSFHETKNVGCGEGGALIVSDPRLLDRAYELRDKGTNRRRFLAGQVDKYTWTGLGSSFGLPDLNAAYLLGQLEAADAIAERRRHLHEAYMTAVADAVTAAGGYIVGGPPARGTSNHHLFAIVLADEACRDRFIAHMRGRGVVTPFHYAALHLSPMGRACHRGPALPTSERLSSCLVRLPLFYNRSDGDQARVIDAALEALRGC